MATHLYLGKFGNTIACQVRASGLAAHMRHAYDGVAYGVPACEAALLYLQRCWCAGFLELC